VNSHQFSVELWRFVGLLSGFIILLGERSGLIQMPKKNEEQSKSQE
jgi:hypothetical protein